MSADTYQYLLGPEGVLVAEKRGDIPQIVGSVPLVGEKLQLLQYGNVLYVACGSQGVAVIVLTDPAHAVLHGYIAQGQPALRLRQSGVNLMVGLATGAELIFSITDPVVPQYRATSGFRPLPAVDDEVPRVAPKRPERRGLGMTIAGASVFGGLYILGGLLWSGLDSRMAIPVGGPIWVSASLSPSLVPFGIMDGIGQLTGIILLAAGASQLQASSSTSPVSSLAVSPYALNGSGGLFVTGRF
jgi:hypothetical protein